jgi:hypothetical protein
VLCTLATCKSIRSRVPRTTEGVTQHAVQYVALRGFDVPCGADPEERRQTEDRRSLISALALSTCPSTSLLGDASNHYSHGT